MGPVHVFLRYIVYVDWCVENLLRNVSTDSQLNWHGDQPTRISAVQFPDDVIDHDEHKQEVCHGTYGI